ncbi:hypothetical protein HP499_21890 [Paenarthrobacter sp. CM16]|uniref:hypothetical protein n=1 Tax=Paenarthrobacter sp. CM16 TaxID=2738447 RepID=UPI00155620E2|nr:hypothetical protein [Paenarthrobacter sp. CM16]NQD90439.1 hypothetical protein [Paenarthrobacter sp. CM16]
MSTGRLLQLCRRWLGITPGQHGGAPDDGGAGAAVVDPSRGTVHIQLTVMGQPL